MRKLLLFLTVSFSLLGDPWGKDADLTLKRISPPPQKKGILSKAGASLIQFHHDVISPADGPRSHFIPSSSYYTQEAMRKYGFVKGFLMGCDRLMRENQDPWIYKTTQRGAYSLKYNPVK